LSKQDEEEFSISALIEGRPEPPMREPAMAMLAGLMDVGSAIWLFQLVIGVISFGPMGWTGWSFYLDMVLTLYYFSLFCGIMVLVSAPVMFFFRPRPGGIISIVFSALALITGFGNGFLFGSILGIAAGVLALQERKFPEPGSSTEII